MKNRWGFEVKRGMKVTAHHPRGGQICGTVEFIDRTSKFAQTYGARAVLDSGHTISVDDLRGVTP